MLACHVCSILCFPRLFQLFFSIYIYYSPITHVTPIINIWERENMSNSSIPLFLLLLVLCIISASADPYYENSDYKSSSSYTTSRSDTVFSLQVPTLDETTFDNLLSFGYYRKTCPQFESILHNKVKEWIKEDYTLAASLMRLHFHDCSVRVHNIYYPSLFLLHNSVLYRKWWMRLCSIGLF